MPGIVKVVSHDANNAPVTDSAGNPAINTKVSEIGYTEGVLATYDAEIYNVNGDVTTDGSIVSGLSDYKFWTFQVTGIVSGATLAIQVSLDGTNFDFVGLKRVGASGNPALNMSADGVYIMSALNGTSVWPVVAMPFKSMFVDRTAAGTGNGDIVVRALGRS